MFHNVVTAVRGIDGCTNEFCRALDLHLNTAPDEPLHPVQTNRMYELTREILKILCTDMLGNDACNREIDKLYEGGSECRQILDKFRHMRSQFTIAITRAYSILRLESQLLSRGRVSLSSMCVLCVAAMRRVEDELDQDRETKATFSLSFPCVITYALNATKEQVTTAIEALSCHGVIKALYAIYVVTPRVIYQKDFEIYSGLILRRALDLLMTPGDEEVWNMQGYRNELECKGQFRYSALFLRDVSIMWYALTEYFDTINLVPVCFDPHGWCQPTTDNLRNARSWLHRYASADVDVWVRDMLVRLSLRAGEVELYNADHRAQKAVPEVVIRENRVSDFYSLTEIAPLPSVFVVRNHLIPDREFEQNGPWAQRESLHLSLVVLSTFRSRLKSCVGDLDPNGYAILGSQLAEWSNYLTTAPKRPVLVLMYNHLQLWFDGQMLMYNNAMEALTAWMIVVDRRLGGLLESHSVRELIDDFLHPTDTSRQRLQRLAAVNTAEIPDLGNGGVF